mmetsp:Transcript_69506/g.137481  ORF Transcript_69506/g.137481 Transcript_69506/m.137481 type:complete len:93 (+) Transcript_69506:138-416(+)
MIASHGCWRPAAIRRLPFAGCWMLASGCWLPAASRFIHFTLSLLCPSATLRGCEPRSQVQKQLDMDFQMSLKTKKHPAINFGRCKERGHQAL